MEPITYANGCTLEDPAISYGIVFSNFMSKGVFTFEGGTDRLIGLMEDELPQSGVDVRINVRRRADRLPRAAASRGVEVNGRTITCRRRRLERQPQRHDFQPRRRGVLRSRVSSTRPGPCGSTTPARRSTWPSSRTSSIDESTGDLLFSSTAPLFRTELLLSRDITSRTYSFYYPRTRPEAAPRCLIVSSTNARYDDWADLCPRRVRGEQARPGRDDARRARQIRARHPRAARSRRSRRRRVTFEHYTKHVGGASFGTKFEGLAVSRALPAADRRPVPRRQRRHHHVGLARRDELRRDRGQRRRHIAHHEVLAPSAVVTE